MPTRSSLLIVCVLAACGQSVTTPSTLPAGSAVPPANPPPQACGAGGLMDSIGRKKLLVGYSGTRDVGAAAPFDLRYQYLCGGPIGDPSQNCSAWDWWQCWEQNLGEPPHGNVVQELISNTKENGGVAMFTYYVILQASGVGEGAAEVKQAATDRAFMAKYLADFRTMLDRIGSNVAFVHVEPDFWGYAGQLTIPNGQDAHALPAAVNASGDCPASDFEQTIAGLGRCMIAMVRTHAPNAKVGLHASAWGTNQDVLLNKTAGFDTEGEGQKLGRFLVSAGADLGDFVVADMSDRDAGCYAHGSDGCSGAPRDTWWHTDSTLPNFTQAFTWAKAVADTVGRPILWWQIPVGNMSQNNTVEHWQDNRVDYLLHHATEVVAGGGIGLAFGAGEIHQTTPSTDGNYLVDMTSALANAGGIAICP